MYISIQPSNFDQVLYNPITSKLTFQLHACKQQQTPPANYLKQCSGYGSSSDWIWSDTPAYTDLLKQAQLRKKLLQIW